MSTRIHATMGGDRLCRPGVVAAVLVAVVMAGGAGCVRIDGGAVEFSWVLRTPDGRAISDCGCSQPQVASVRLDLQLQSVDGTTIARPCEGRAQCQFACQRGTGATPFDIPANNFDETYLISVQALATDGTMLTTVGTPVAVSRSVVKGQPTDIGALLLVTDCADECSGVNGQGVCERP